LIYIVYF
jgi:hypothetical protein